MARRKLHAHTSHDEETGEPCSNGRHHANGHAQELLTLDVAATGTARSW